MKRVSETLGPAPKRRKNKPSPRHYGYSEGTAFLFISNKLYKIRVLLDSSSNTSLINQNTGRALKVPYGIRENSLKITGFDGEIFSIRRKYFSHPIKLEIRTNGHKTIISCEIADSGKYDIIIPFGWWHQEHRITILENPGECFFAHTKCIEQVQDGGIADMFKWEETGAFNNARMIGRIGSTGQEEVQLKELPKPDWQ